jgi:hypothetical protein
MTVDGWLRAALADAEGRGLPELAPLLQTLAQVTRTLRGADVLRQEPVPRNPASGVVPMRPAESDGE